MPELRYPRVNAYEERISQSLTDVYLMVPQGPQRREAGAEWILTHVLHINGYAQCELCGHFPIRRLFFIKNITTDDEKVIGSECARNYLSVDLVRAWERNLARGQRRARDARIGRERRERREENDRATSAISGGLVQEFREQNADLIQFLNENRTSSRFLSDIGSYLDRVGYLTTGQVVRVREIMSEQDDVQGGSVYETEATYLEALNVPNGTFDVTRITSGDTHRFQIYTVTRGSLAGKRIVKRRGNGPGGWQGFAFVTRLGNLRVWRRFSADESLNADYIQFAHSLLEALRFSYGGSTPITNTFQASSDVSSSRAVSHVIAGRRGRIKETPSCRKCNGALVWNSISTIQLETGFCADCRLGNHDIQSLDSRSRFVNTTATDVEDTVHRSPRRRTPRAPAPSQGALDLSELGTGEIR